MELYDYQDDCLAQTHQAYRQGFNAPLLVMPTGAGKTMTFACATQKASIRGKRVLLVAHRRELVGQISEALSRWDVPHGMISPAHPPTTQGVQVAMAQTLARRIPLDRDGRFRFDLVIVDEAHHATQDSTWGAILKHNAGAKFLGVTATPCRLDGKGLGVQAGGFFDFMVIGPTVEDLIARGRLAPPVVYAPEFGADLSGVKKRGGDYDSKGLAAAMENAKLTGNVVAHYRQLCAGAPSIAFTVDTKHAAMVADEFKAAGYAAAVLTGSTQDKERAAMIKDLGAGRLNVLASCNVISEGTDIPMVMAAILLRPTMSFALAMQQMGRALRAFPGKDKAIILDHAGNTHKHGLPTEQVEWSLDGVIRKGGGKVRTCFGCGGLLGVAVRVCPACGKDVGGKGTESPKTEQEDAFLLVKEGKLIELTPELRREMQNWRRTQQQKAKSLEDFMKIGERMGYHPNWAAYRFKELGHG